MPLRRKLPTRQFICNAVRVKVLLFNEIHTWVGAGIRRTSLDVRLWMPADSGIRCTIAGLVATICVACPQAIESLVVPVFAGQFQMSHDFGEVSTQPCKFPQIHGSAQCILHGLQRIASVGARLRDVLGHIGAAG
jgi:hypothetical protein